MSQFQRFMHVSRSARERFGLGGELFSLRGTALFADLKLAQQAAYRINAAREAERYPELAIRAGELYAAGLIHELLHLLIAHHQEALEPGLMAGAYRAAQHGLGDALEPSLKRFSDAFPPGSVYRNEETLEGYYASATQGVPNRLIALEEALLLSLSNENPALERFTVLLDDGELRATSAYPALVARVRAVLDAAPTVGGMTLFEALSAPALMNPTSLEGQLEYLRRTWAPVLGARAPQVFGKVLQGLDVIKEERKGAPPGGPGPAHVLTFTDAQATAAGQLGGTGAVWGPEHTKRQPVAYERFSPDSSWMPRVVMLAKSTYVWLEQLSKRYGRHIHRLEHIPDEELDDLARRGFTCLWLIGLWERSEASRRIKHLRGNPDAVASAYALYDYVIAEDLGGEAAFENLRDRAWARGVRLASDMVPNHVGIDGKWVLERPDYFLQLPEPPYPGYTFGGPDLSSDERVGIFLEDHYWDSSDAAVVFKRLERATGEARYLYHGNDGTTFPWNDTAQLDYLNPEAREAVMQTILHVARKFSVIRFDAAMTLAKQHVQRLWYPEPGEGGAIPSRAQHGAMPHEVFETLMPDEFWREVVDRVAAEVPDTLLLAEAFWMMEPYFVRTLGMHRVYNSAFMHMFKNEENDKYRLSIKNTLVFDPEILKRFVNFMNNPDEETAAAQFGKGDKYFGVCAVMCTLPGLPMFGHGQLEGFVEKYGMEYRRAKLDETPDGWLLERHAREVFPLLHRRAEFAEVENFALYDVNTPQGVNENVFAYSNRLGERASLVLYNNAYASAAGFIRDSAPYNDKSGGQRSRTLVDALGLSGGEGMFALMREHISGLEFLRPSRELAEQGLYLELAGYQYQVFTDIHEAHDADGRLAALSRRLGERGVPSLADALREQRFEPLHEAYGWLLSALSENRDDAGAALGAFLAQVQQGVLATEGEQAQGLLASVVADADALSRVRARITSKTDDDPDFEPGREGAPFADLAVQTPQVWLAWALLCHLADRAGGDAQAGGEGVRLRVLESLGLEPFWERRFGWWPARLLRLLAALPVERLEPEAAELAEPDASASGTSESEDREPTASATTPRRRARQPAPPDAEAARHRLAPLLSRDDAKAFLRINSYEGATYFEQDAYRLLATGLCVTDWLGQDDRSEADLLVAFAGFGALESSSDYRVDRLLGPAPVVASEEPQRVAADLAEDPDPPSTRPVEPDEPS